MLSRGEFARILRERTVILDGAYGTSFFEMGFGGVPGEVLNLENPQAVEAVHRSYVEAGAGALLTNTFGANRLKLAENGLDSRIREINFEAVRLARGVADSADGPVLVLGDMTSTGDLPAPSGGGSFDRCRDAYGEQASLLLEAGCDALIVETMTDIKELKAAVIGIREASAETPLIVQMSFDSSGTTLTGASVEVFAAVMNDLDADVLGMNCLLGPEEMLANMRRLSAATSLPLSVEPNAGDPEFDGKRTVYRTDPVAFSLYAENYVELGVAMIGGCCGTTPEHIAKTAALLRGVVPGGLRPRTPDTGIYATSRTSVFDMSSAFSIIGERINPTGKKALRESMRARDWSPMLDEAAAQSSEGADLLDVNFGVEKFFDEEAITSAFVALDRATTLPLSIDVQTIELMERALAEYPGRPLINSSACDDASLDRKLPLLKKYGGVMILLAMDSEIPNTAADRLAVVERALARAEAMGLGRGRFVVDPLVLSFGAGYDHRVTLETIRLCAERGLLTVCGLSNLSHGMPNRAGINAAFLSQAVDVGLSGAIMNSGEQVLLETLYGSLLLKTGEIGESAAETADNPLVTALLAGRAKIVDALVDEKLQSGVLPLEVSQDFLGAAMEEIGLLYERKKIFLPHILFAAETAFPVFDRLNEMMEGDGAKRGLVLMATVEGDIHDIGKNIVATVLRAGGFEVVDAGKNVPAARIAEIASEKKPDIVGLSAMMTTTVGRVPEVADAIAQKGLQAHVIAGGASMNPELATLFGVRYSGDSSGALALCRELVGSNE